MIIFKIEMSTGVFSFLGGKNKHCKYDALSVLLSAMCNRFTFNVFLLTVTTFFTYLHLTIFQRVCRISTTVENSECSERDLVHSKKRRKTCYKNSRISLWLIFNCLLKAEFRSISRFNFFIIRNCDRAKKWAYNQSQR